MSHDAPDPRRSRSSGPPATAVPPTRRPHHRQRDLHVADTHDRHPDRRGGEHVLGSVLTARAGGWATFYSERGLETGRREFDIEDEAGAHLLDVIMRDPTTR